jgi:biopolymer transport protein ExbB
MFSKFSSRTAFILLAAALTASIALVPVYGQAAPENAPAATEGQPASDQTQGAANNGEAAVQNPEEAPAEGNGMAKAGEIHFDPTAWVMLGLGFLVIAVTIERALVIYFNTGKNDKLVQLLTEELIKNPHSIKELSEKAAEKIYGLSGRVAAMALKGWNYGNETMLQYGETAIMAERRNLERRLVILSTLGNNIPFIGLLGTVLGIMKAFRDLANQGGDAGPAVVMLGISEALVATAMGLIIAVPTVVFYNVLAKSVKDAVSKAEEIIHLIGAIRLSTNNGTASGSNAAHINKEATVVSSHN